MPSQTDRGDVIHIGLDSEIDCPIEIEFVKSHKDIRHPPKLDVSEVDGLAPLLLQPRDDICINGSTEDVLTILWIGNPAGLGTAEDCSTPRLDSKRESQGVNFAGGCPDVISPLLNYVKEIEEDDHLGRGDERGFEVDTHGSRR